MNKEHLIGNAHLDPAWLWQWQEGFAEIKATFRSALDRMKEFPEYKFTSACSLYYMWIEKSDPAMFAEIAARVKEGRWCIAGGWLIQPDCNIPCGESFARHALISQRYFREKFGVTAVTGYNVDSFGHNGSLPVILRNSGMKNYVFMRPGPHEKELPADLFTWRSADGSTVDAYRIPYYYDVDMRRLDCFEKVWREHPDYDCMLFYGIGNHGGGATIELLDYMRRTLDERYVYSTPDEYFETVRGVKKPVVDGDLQFHAKGCYSAFSEVKAGNRKAENRLLSAEKFSALSRGLVGTEYPAEEFRRAWTGVLFNQFHDILGGCSIREVYESAGYLHGEALSIAERTENFALQQISWSIDTSEATGKPWVVFNPNPFPVTAVVCLRNGFFAVTEEDGTPVPSQRVRGSQTNGSNRWATAFPAELPALGYRVYRGREAEGESRGENAFTTGDGFVENSRIRLTLCPETGEVAGIYSKEKNAELLSAATRTVLIDETGCDTWAHGETEFRKEVFSFTDGEIRVLEAGPVRATIRSVMRGSETVIIRDYTLTADSDVITVRAKIDFREKHKMLKFRFPVRTGCPQAVCKIPFGSIERPVDGTEQVCGSWMVLKDGRGTGLSVATDSRHSFDAEGGVLSLTVLRGAVYADHYGQRDSLCEFTEQGLHEFTYSLAPFRSLSESERQACRLENPAAVVPETFHPGKLPASYCGLSVSQPNIVVTAVKKHEDSEGTVLRCYEAEGHDTDAEIEWMGQRYALHFARHEVKTLLLGGEKAEELLFTEYAE